MQWIPSRTSNSFSRFWKLKKSCIRQKTLSENRFRVVFSSKMCCSWGPKSTSKTTEPKRKDFGSDHRGTQQSGSCRFDSVASQQLCYPGRVSGKNLGEESLDSGFISWFLVEQKNSSNCINHNVLIWMKSYVTYAFSCTFVIPQKLLVR